MTPILICPRLLSIQSHVVSGYCGNKSATFPLQLLELEVDVVNTVQLSNHTQYKVAKGQVYGSKDLEEIHSGLKENNLLRLYDNIISGYVLGINYIESMASLIRDIKFDRNRAGKACWYTFDPVLGDDGVGFYASESEQVIEAYKKHLIPLADIITPNRFEASILTGQDIDTSSENALAQAMKAIAKFHEMGVRVAVITSLELQTNKDQLNCILSHRESDLIDTWLIRVPKLPCAFTGTGDLFTALLTGWLRKTDFDFVKSFENTTNSIHEILEDTYEWYRFVDDGSVQSFELRLVQNKESIMRPKNRFKAKRLEPEISLSQG